MTSIEYEDWLGEHYNNGPEIVDSWGAASRLMTCRVCRALVEDNQDCLEAHDRWHNNLKLRVEPLLAKSSAETFDAARPKSPRIWRR